MKAILPTLAAGALFSVLFLPISAPSADEEPLVYISLVNLLVQPENVPSHRIAVVGYLSNVGSPYLYLTEAHAAFLDMASGIKVIRSLGSGSFDGCVDRYVQVVGHYDPTSSLGEPVILAERVMVPSSLGPDTECFAAADR